MFNKIISFFKQDKEAQETIRQLSALTDKELHDIGISRGDIYSIAHGSDDYNRTRVNKNLEGWV